MKAVGVTALILALSHVLNPVMRLASSPVASNVKSSALTPATTAAHPVVQRRAVGLAIALHVAPNKWVRAISNPIHLLDKGLNARAAPRF